LNYLCCDHLQLLPCIIFYRSPLLEAVALPGIFDRGFVTSFSFPLPSLAFPFPPSVCVQHRSKSTKQILTNFSEKISNDKICSYAMQFANRLISQHLVPRYSESPAVPHSSQFGGWPKQFFRPLKLCTKFPPLDIKVKTRVV